MALLNPARRRLTRALALGSLSGWWMAPLLAAGSEPALRGSAAMMGTRVDLALDGGGSAAELEQAMRLAVAEMERLATMMSRYLPDNPVAALQRQAGRRPVRVPPEMFAVLQMAQGISRSTGGAFDVTVGGLSSWQFNTPDAELPSAALIARELRLVDYRDLHLDEGRRSAFLARPGMRIDLGGVAKLPILQAGMDTLRRHGVTGAMINGGGDVLVRGALRGRPWRIGLRDPARPEQLLAVLPLNDGIVASSGDYERGWERSGHRYHHILDPATGYPTEQVHGVSLVATDLHDVNGLGAAAMVLGPQAGAALLSRQPQRQALLVRRDGGLWVSPGLAVRLQPAPGQDRVRGLVELRNS